LEQLVVDVADRAALDATLAWRNRTAGRTLMRDAGGLQRASPELRAAVGPEIRAWQDGVLDMVRERGEGKRTSARILALGLNSVGVALMIVLFSSTGGLTGGEVVIASGTAGLSQALLTALFGEQAVRELAERAREDLLERVGRLLDADAERFRQHLAQLDSDGSAVHQGEQPVRASRTLRSRLEEFERARAATGRKRPR
jgi:hypothetical protein